MVTLDVLTHRLLVGWLWRGSAYCVQHQPRGVAYAAMTAVYDYEAPQRAYVVCGRRLVDLDAEDERVRGGVV